MEVGITVSEHTSHTSTRTAFQDGGTCLHGCATVMYVIGTRVHGLWSGRFASGGAGVHLDMQGSGWAVIGA